jgi:hypothetical protein
MTPGSKRLLGNIILAIAIIVLVVEFCGMLGWIPKFMPSMQMSLLVLMLAVVAGALRRSRTVA